MWAKLSDSSSLHLNGIAMVVNTMHKRLNPEEKKKHDMKIWYWCKLFSIKLEKCRTVKMFMNNIKSEASSPKLFVQYFAKAKKVQLASKSLWPEMILILIQNFPSHMKGKQFWSTAKSHNKQKLTFRNKPTRSFTHSFQKTGIVQK